VEALLLLNAKATMLPVRLETGQQVVREEVSDLLPDLGEVSDLLLDLGEVEAVVAALAKGTGHRAQDKAAKISTKWPGALMQATFPFLNQQRRSRKTSARKVRTPQASSNSLPLVAVNLIAILAPAEALLKTRRVVPVEATGDLFPAKMSLRRWRMPKPNSKPIAPRP